MASSAGDAAHHHGFDGGVILSPPPPTPSNQSLASSLPADFKGVTVWSNGRFKRVRSRPQPTSLPFDGCDGTGCTSLTVLVTVPLDTVISPLLPSAVEGCGAGDADEDDGRRFHAFYLEEYAWRIYHERLPPQRSTVEISELASS